MGFSGEKGQIRHVTEMTEEIPVLDLQIAAAVGIFAWVQILGTETPGKWEYEV